MQLNDFLQKFLPDYKDKRVWAMRNSPMFYGHTEKELWVWAVLFPEALKNFADKICEKQRENCLNNACIDELSIDGVWVASLVDKSTILDAEQPKIEEL